MRSKCTPKQDTVHVTHGGSRYTFVREVSAVVPTVLLEPTEGVKQVGYNSLAAVGKIANV